MLKIFPFRGIQYNPSKIEDLNHVVIPPFGQLGAEHGELFMDRHQFNIARLHGTPVQGETIDDPYKHSGELMRQWLQDGILKRESEPVLYAYHQDYVLGHMEQRLCRGFICLCELQEYSSDGIYPHEQTFPPPLQERLTLLQEMQGSFGPVMLLYRDTEQKIEALLSEYCQGSPDQRVIDDWGVLHMLWRITDTKAIQQVQDLMRKRSCLIADGHHRYEAALSYRDKMKQENKSCEAPDSCDNIIAAMFNIDQEGGLTILPTHRVIHSLPQFSLDLLLQKLKRYFNIYEYPVSGGKRDFLEDLRFEGYDNQVFGLVVKDSPSYYLLSLHDSKNIQMYFTSATKDTMRSLDAVLLHEVILEKFLSLSHKDGNHKQFITFERNSDTAIRIVEEEDGQCAFLMNPLHVEQVQEIAESGQLLPQKSTDFYPKVLTGLVGHSFDFHS